jgi:RNA-directed DNA polymerase
VVSPLLANIALNGIEDIHQSVRYADDMVIILKPKDNAEVILGKISQFLAERGMNVSEKKTQLPLRQMGLISLGWHFRVQSNGKFRCVPSVDNFKAFRQKVKHIVNNSNYGATVKAEKLAPVVRGWRNYHRYCKMDGSRFSLYTSKQSVQGVQQGNQTNRYTSKKLLEKRSLRFLTPKTNTSKSKGINPPLTETSSTGVSVTANSMTEQPPKP